MFQQTSSINFSNYGSVSPILPKDINLYKYKYSLSLHDKCVKYFFYCECDSYVKLKSGVVLIVVSKDSTFSKIESFILNSKVKIKKGIYYNFIPISSDCSVDLFGEMPFLNSKSLEKPYIYNELIPSINIKKIFTKFYQDKKTNYKFNGEKHYFWELTFIDRGVLYTDVDEETFQLSQGELLFYAPNQYHNQYTDSSKSCSYLTVSFDMNLEDHTLLSNRIISCDKELYSILNSLMRELNSSNIYSPELAICYLKQLILKILMKDTCDNKQKRCNSLNPALDDNLLNNIINFIHDNVYKTLTIPCICREFNISSSKLHLLFKNNFETTVKAHINALKLSKSKELMKESSYSIGEISEMLNFSSIHYFSNKFKKEFGYSPKEYLKSINKD